MPRKKQDEADVPVDFETIVGMVGAPSAATDLAAALPDDPDAPPKQTSRDWTPFVLSKLEDDEIFDGCPTVEGLRRVTEEYFGEVLESTSRVVQAPNAQNGFH